MDWSRYFTYHEDGYLIWKNRPESDFPSSRTCKMWNSRFANKRAGVKNEKRGYIYITIDNVKYMAHRAIWEILKSKIPEGHQIDHVNGFRDDNKISNLRVVTQSVNNRNSKMRDDNTSGFCGVCWDKNRSKWIARAGLNGKTVNLGRFDTREEAIKVRLEFNKKNKFTLEHGGKNEIQGLYER
ncbi:HNH homing endonuclease [Shigella phage Sf12]|uniref:HNH homing endonuclease n=1 Tax=Shigella phage Sf12 TaxID=2024315 RepID=A0A291AXK2_9CAUD|nr:HNH endonuclease [Shigella phage Sf12]ATE85757.1 HNH homing endonuclease [Shigella phage Sf12]